MRKCARLHNVIGLCRSPTDAAHAILIEGYEEVTVTGDVVGVFGYYGVVIKAAAARFDNAAAWLNSQVGVYIKSGEQATSVVRNIEIKSITSLSAGPAQGFAPYTAPGGTGLGVVVQASGANVDKVNIGQIREVGHATGVDFAFLTGTKISSVKIGSIMTDGNSVQGTNFQAGAGFTLSRLDVGSIESRNTPVALTAAWDSSDDSSVHIGAVMGVNCTLAVLALSQSADPIIECVVADNCAAAYYLAGQAAPTIGALKLVDTSVIYSVAGSSLAPALKNGWTQYAGNDEFGVDLVGGVIRLRGLVAPGSSNILCTLPPYARPRLPKRLNGTGFNGAVQSTVPVLVGSDGNILVNEIAGGTANVSVYLSLAGISFSRY